MGMGMADWAGSLALGTYLGSELEDECTVCSYFDRNANARASKLEKPT